MHCSVINCVKPAKRQSMCCGHYMKQWRYGTPTPTFDAKWEDITGARFGALVVVGRAEQRWLCRCDCGSSAVVRTGDLNRGSVSTCGDRATHWRREDIKYAAAHDRVRQDRGLVQQHRCIGCGQAAQHWSYNHTDPDELLALDISANPVAYSVDPVHYSPRCIKCHKRFDLGHINAMPSRTA